MNDMRIEAERSGTAPDYRPLAEHWMQLILRWYEDPENEAEYQRWKQAREAQGGRSTPVGDVQ